MTTKEWNLKLNTGAKIPAFGLGTWHSEAGKWVPPTDMSCCGAAVEAALRVGYRHIDCAHIYGNEAEIGEALQKCFREGVVKRKELFVTSKLWSADYEPENVLPACQLSLKKLELDYLDLYLMHSPIRIRKGAQFPLKEEDKLGYDAESTSKCWESMEELVSKGLCKAVGISNFSITKTESLLKTAKIVPAVNQVECHPYFQQHKLKKYCDMKGIIFEAYSPLGNPSRPSRKDSELIVMEDPVIRDIAAFALHRGLVVIPKTVNPARILENLEATKLTLSEDDMKKLTEVDKNYRLYKMEGFLKKNTTWQEARDVEADEKFEL